MANESAHPILRQLHKMVSRQAIKDRTDPELLQQFATKRDESSFAALVERHGPLVWNVCHRVLRHRHDAEDAFQATFLVLARRASSVCNKEAISSWLYGVAYRTALSQKRAAQRRRRREKQGQIREPEQSSSATASLHELQAMLDEEVARLPAKYRAPFVLCCLEGRSYAQAARELEWKEGTVSSRLAKARELLQARITRRGVTLSAVQCATPLSPSAQTAPAALIAATTEGVLHSLNGTTTTALSAQAMILAKEATKTLSATMRRLGAILLVTAAPMACVGFWCQQEPRIQQQVEAQPQKAQQNALIPPPESKKPKPADNKADFADAEMHVIGTYWAKDKSDQLNGSIEVEVRPTVKPILLVLTSYFSVDWHIKLAKGARIKKVIVSGYFAQEIKGLPADVPVANRSYFPDDGSRRKDGWYWAYQWNTPQWREMVRRLNKETGLPLASFQGKYAADSFIVDGKRGRDQGQNGVIPRPRRNKELTPKELLTASANAELHAVGISVPDIRDRGKPIEVEVRKTAKPVVLVVTSGAEAITDVKLAQGARIKAVLVAGSLPQEVEGLPDDIPVNYYCPDGSSYYFNRRGSQRDKECFGASRWNTFEYRRMVERLNELTGLLVSSFQGEHIGTSFVVDGKRGSNFAQKERKRRSTLPKEPRPQELLAASKGAGLHVVSIYGPARDNKNGDAIDVEVLPTDKPIVLALASYYTVLWRVKIAPEAHVKAVIIGGYFEQEFEGIPVNIPIVYRAYFPSRKDGNFYAFKWNTVEYRRMVEQLNNLAGLLVSTFQVEYEGASFVVDGKRGRNFAQKERKQRPTLPKEPTPRELLAASAGAELHVVSIYWSDRNSKHGDVIDVDVRPTDKPIVLALVSYMTVLWNVRIAPGAQVKAVIIGGYFEQEFEGIPANIPIVYRAYFPSRKDGYLYGYKWDTPECQKVVQRLHNLTGLRISTFQGEYAGTSFVVDGKRGRDFAKGERKVEQKRERAQEDPLADVADIPSQELRASGDTYKRYFLIGPKKDAKPPAEGHSLLVILPGGDGSADFHPFVKRIYKNALSDRYLAVQPIAVKWTPDQEIVWPTKKLPVAKMKFSTEEFIDAAIEDAAKKHKIDRKNIFSLSWSSSGPAAYAASLRDKPSVKGSFIAMSVFKPQLLPPLKAAKGRPYYLYHSPDDRICPFRMAEQAKRSLTDNGAKVRLKTYEGGHGWRGNVYGEIGQGIEWLEKNLERASSP